MMGIGLSIHLISMLEGAEVLQRETHPLDSD